MKNEVIDNMKLSNYLFRALERNKLELYYQSQVDANSDKIIGLEALLRYNNNELGIVLPDMFIHVAEKPGLIIPIGEWALHTACRQN